MSCFIVPMAQAVATTLYRKSHSSNTENLASLEKMLWGGTIMLIVDHIANGEITLTFPFFTALAQEGGSLVMLKEMLTVGIPMSITITVIWALYVAIKSRRTVKA